MSRLETLGPLRRRDGEPAFDEPWQAQALGMADMLVSAGVISADAWATELGKELRKSATAGAPDDLEAYYRAVLAALQTLLYETGAAAREDVDIREAEWRSAYLATPHGKPVELTAGFRHDSRNHVSAEDQTTSETQIFGNAVEERIIKNLTC